MFLVSSGKGIWVFGTLFISLGIALGVEHFVAPGANKPWVISLGFAASGAACIVLGLCARRDPPRMVFERQTGRERYMRPGCTAYWIPAEYWGIAFLALGVWFYGLKP